MARYEYMMLRDTGTLKKMEEQIKILGQKGWKLAGFSTVFQALTRDGFAIMERIVEPKRPPSEVLKNQLAKLEAAHKRGEISDKAYLKLKSELEGEEE